MRSKTQNILQIISRPPNPQAFIRIRDLRYLELISRIEVKYSFMIIISTAASVTLINGRHTLSYT